MPRIKLTIEYDGTNYVGWQMQPNGISIQHQVENAILRLSGSELRVHSSGRTDAGVHAGGMVCHFDIDRALPMSAWREGLNRFLPEDIVIRLAEEVAENFHARFSATGKWYRYTIFRSDVRSPLLSRNSWLVRQELDIDKMRQAASGLLGEHDFAAFRTSGCAAKTTCREIYSLDLLEEGPLLYVDVKGSGFLKNMVRMMVGTLVDVGRNKRPVADIQAMLATDIQALPAFTAPARGLCLMEVWY